MGERVLTFWGHLDTDGISCLGYADWICVGVLRRRWKKWKLNELAAHFKDNYYYSYYYYYYYYYY